MRCPHCNKEIKKLDKEEIMEEIRVNKYSIADLTRLFNVNRSIMRYYLGLLKEDGKIKYDRQQKLPGRPVIIKENKKYEK